MDVKLILLLLVSFFTLNLSEISLKCDDGGSTFLIVGDDKMSHHSSVLYKIMSNKVRKSVLLNRLRVQKHRKVKRLQSKPYVRPDRVTESHSCEFAEITVKVPCECTSCTAPVLPSSAAQENYEDTATKDCLQRESTYSFSWSATHDSSSSDKSDDSSDDEAVEFSSAQASNSNNSSISNKLADRLRQWALSCIPSYKVDELLKILKPYHNELPACSKTLFKTSLNLHENIRDLDKSKPPDESQFIYFEIVRFLIKMINPNLHLDGIIFLMFDIDGLPLYESSALSFWPLMRMVFHQGATHEPFPIAVFCGDTKPSSAMLYLDEFINKINELCKNGIKIGDRVFVVKIKCFICDGPARSFVKCIQNHGTFYACERCLGEGCTFKDRRVYPVRDEPQRTEESFRRLENTEHYNGISPLMKLEPALNLMKLFVLAFMHLGCLGI